MAAMGRLRPPKTGLRSEEQKEALAFVLGEALNDGIIVLLIARGKCLIFLLAASILSNNESWWFLLKRRCRKRWQNLATKQTTSVSQNSGLDFTG